MTLYMELRQQNPFLPYFFVCFSWPSVLWLLVIINSLRVDQGELINDNLIIICILSFLEKHNISWGTLVEDIFFCMKITKLKISHRTLMQKFKQESKEDPHLSKYSLSGKTESYNILWRFALGLDFILSSVSKWNCVIICETVFLTRAFFSLQ